MEEDGDPRCRRDDLLENFKSFGNEDGVKIREPVTFPPGRERLAIIPSPTGSGWTVITMGMVLVAFLAARIAASP
jgi:hypothetical protein